MIKFAFKDYEVEMNNWSKHHKAVGVRVKRVYENGEEVLPTDEKLKQLVLVNEEILQPVNVQLIKRRLYERYNQCRRHDSVRWQ